MKPKYFLFAFTFFLLSNCNSKEDEKYADKLEDFAVSMKNKYGAEYQDKVEFYELNSFSDSINGVPIGNYSFKDYYGNEINLLTASKPVLLEFFASWCAPCISSIPALNKLSLEYPEVRFIVLAHDTSDKLKKYADQFNSNIHLIPSDKEVNAGKLLKLEVGEFQSVFPFPATFSIDANGIIQNVLLGAPRSGTFGGIKVTEEEVHEANLLRLRRELDKIVSK
ncbi:TlpA disulfide reductase family protein [Marivirga tractuosa]|uniref:TlpA family protein disulfide reductase n=1 Tax=Marivirga tractuosa TaxID=1006 RepID=UPI0035CF7F77